MPKTWDDIQKIAERNALFLDRQPDDFLETDVDLAEEELILLLWLLLDDFETENGKVKKSTKNFFLVNRVDEVFQAFATAGGLLLIGKLMNRFGKVLSNNFKYFSAMLDRPIDPVKKRMTMMVNTRLGIEPDGTMVKDGYMSSLIGNTSIRNEAREMLFRGVLSGSKTSDLRNQLKNFITGEKDKPGAIYKFYSKFAYDTFGQIDRMSSVGFALEYDLKWFIYYGTIIKSSRAFCRKHINGIYNVEEAKNWIFQQPAPVGVSATTYDPVIDMGGVNCRHSPFFLTDEMADDMFNRGFSNAPSNI